MSRIDPVEPPYSDAVRTYLEKSMGGMTDVEPLKLFRTLAVHDEMAGRMRPLGAGILGRSARVEPRLREVMIHRTCALTGAEYEWGVHVVAFARPLGFSEEQIESTVNGSATDSCWAEDESLVMRLAEELHATSDVSDELFDDLREHLRADQILELVMTSGWYHAISFVIAVSRVEPEDWAARFPR